MSTFMFNPFAGVDNLSKTASGIGIFPPDFIDKKPEKSQRVTGLLSKGPQFTIKLIFSGLYLCLTILRKFIPSFILNVFIFSIPLVLAFYELKLRVYFPWLPSLFAIAVKLFRRGILTIDTIIWLASSLPTNFLGGLGALGSVAMQTTAAMAGVAAGSGNALVGSTTGIVGNASKALAQGINHLNSNVATDITQVLSDGSRIAAADHATSIASLVKNGENAVIGNVSHLISREILISPEHLVPDIAVHTVVDNTIAVTESAVGATKAAITENTTKLAHVALDGANTLFRIMPGGSQDSQLKQSFSGKQAQEPENISQVTSGEDATSPGHLVPDVVAVAENTAKLAHVLGSVNPMHLHIMSTGSESKDTQALPISASEPLIPHNANGGIRAAVGTVHAVADVGTRSATKLLGMVQVGGRNHPIEGLLHPGLP